MRQKIKVFYYVPSANKTVHPLKLKLKVLELSFMDSNLYHSEMKAGRNHHFFALSGSSPATNFQGPISSILLEITLQKTCVHTLFLPQLKSIISTLSLQRYLHYLYRNHILFHFPLLGNVISFPNILMVIFLAE